MLIALIFLRTLYRTELELVASKATMEFIENEIKELEILKSTKQAQLDTLYGKYRQIQDFEKIVVRYLPLWASSEPPNNIRKVPSKSEFYNSKPSTSRKAVLLYFYFFIV